MKKSITLLLTIISFLMVVSFNYIHALPEEIYYSENFDGGGTGDGTLGTLNIVEGKAVVNSAAYTDVKIPVDVTGKPNIEYQFDITYLPNTTVYRYFGVKFWGLNANENAADSSLAVSLIGDQNKDHYLKIDFHDGTAWQTHYNNQSNFGGLFPGALNLVDGQTARIQISIYEDELTIFVNGAPVFQSTFTKLGFTKGEIDGSNFVGEEKESGLTLDNIVVKESKKIEKLLSYKEDFEYTVIENFAEYENLDIVDGKLVSLAQFSNLKVPLQFESPEDWTAQVDVTYKIKEGVIVGGASFLGLNVYDAVLGVTFEFTVELTAEGQPYILVKGAGGEVITHTGTTGYNPLIKPDKAFTFKVQKFGTRVKVYVDNVEYLSIEDENFARPSGFSIFTFSEYEMQMDNILIEASDVIAIDDELFNLGFTDLEENELWTAGNPDTAFTITSEKWAESVSILSQAYPEVDGALFKANWKISYDIIYPDNVVGYFGLNLEGMDSSLYELTIQKLEDDNGYFLVKKNNVEYAHSNGSGGLANPTVNSNQRNHVDMYMTNGDLTIYVNGDLIVKVFIPDAKAPTKIDFYSYDAVGMKFGNFKYSMNVYDLPLTSVTIQASRNQISTLQTAMISSNLNPSSASISSIEWYLNDVLVLDQTGRTFTFGSQTPGTYTIKAIIDDIESNVATIKVTEPTDVELDSIYYENFDTMSNDTGYGDFIIKEGKAFTNNQVYGKKEFTFGFVKNWELSFDYTFFGESDNPTYLGINIQGLVEPASREFELNIKKRSNDETDENKIVIKDSTVETLFNNSETYGRMPEFNIVDGQTYNYKIVRWEDQLELWVDNELAIKTFYSNPGVATRLFLYWYNSSGTNLEIDNLIYRESEEMEEKILPPHVNVESAYISSNKVSAKTGEDIILTLMTEPSFATPVDIQWYMNDVLIEGITTKNYTFNTETVGTYIFKAVIDGVTSDSRTLTITSETINPPIDKPSTGLGTTELTFIILGSVVVLSVFGFAGYWFFLRKKIK